MPDLGPLNIVEILAAKKAFQKQLRRYGCTSADMKELGVSIDLRQHLKSRK